MTECKYKGVESHPIQLLQHGWSQTRGQGGGVRHIQPLLYGREKTNEKQASKKSGCESDASSSSYMRGPKPKGKGVESAWSRSSYMGGVSQKKSRGGVSLIQFLLHGRSQTKSQGIGENSVLCMM